MLGYFTIHGDGAASLKPIAHLYKCQVRALARALGVPQVIIDKAPSADLWEGQTDEGELGFTYDEADQVLYLLTERVSAWREIAALGLRVAHRGQPSPGAWRLRPSSVLAAGVRIGLLASASTPMPG